MSSFHISRYCCSFLVISVSIYVQQIKKKRLELFQQLSNEHILKQRVQVFVDGFHLVLHLDLFLLVVFSRALVNFNYLFWDFCSWRELSPRVYGKFLALVLLHCQLLVAVSVANYICYGCLKVSCLAILLVLIQDFITAFLSLPVYLSIILRRIVFFFRLPSSVFRLRSLLHLLLNPSYVCNLLAEQRIAGVLRLQLHLSIYFVFEVHRPRTICGTLNS